MMIFRKEKELYITIGIAGSGKSTYSSRFPNCFVINKDSIRFMLYNYKYTKIDFIEEFEQFIQSIIRYCFLELIKTDHNIYIDETNLTPENRSFYIENALKCNYKIHFLIFQTNAEKYNQSRERVVPQEILAKQRAKMKLLTDYEKSIATSVTIIH